MKMRVNTGGRLWTRNLLLVGAVAVLVAGAAATPAFADDDWNGRHEWRGREWRHHREHEWREHEWRERYWHRDYPYYGYPPPVIYAPPPAYYAPPPPVAGFNLVFPIR